MKIFGFPVSPFVRKVMLIAAEKGIDYEVVPTNPMEPEDEFLAASPYRKIPAIADGGFTLADSSAIAHYLEAKHPEPALLPTDPQDLGMAVWFDEVADTVVMAAGGPMMFNRFFRAKILGEEHDEEAALKGEEALDGRLPYLEGVAGDGWLNGAFSLGDLALASTLRSFGYADWTLDAARYPNIAAWYARVQDRPAWQRVAEEEAQLTMALTG